MALTLQQLDKLKENRRSKLPSFFNAETGDYQSISQNTEDALILTSSKAKEKAAQYLDLLLDANPTADAFDSMTALMAEQRKAVLNNQLTELKPIIEKFAEFKDDFDGNDNSNESIFTTGTYPIIRSLLRGVGPIRNRINEDKYLRKVTLYAEKKYAGEATDSVRKEWRSWKRVLLLYP